MDAACSMRLVRAANGLGMGPSCATAGSRMQVIQEIFELLLQPRPDEEKVADRLEELRRERGTLDSRARHGEKAPEPELTRRAPRNTLTP